MKKGARKIELGWRLWSLIIGALILIGVAGFSYATNSGNPAIMGHTADEIAGGAGNAVAASLSCVTRTANSPAYNYGDGQYVNVSCNSDEIVTGGGGYCGDGNCFGSKATVTNGWQIFAFSGRAPTAYAICCKVTGTTANSNFGARQNKNSETVYQADSDGFVVADYVCNVNSCNTRINAYVGNTNSPSTRVARSYLGNGGGEDTMTFPVLKGEYWKVSAESPSGISYNSFYFVPTA